MQDDKQLLEQVEKTLLDNIVQNLKTNKMSVEDSENLAKEFLALLPPKDREDLLTKLHGLGRTYQPARETYVELVVPLEEQMRQEKLNVMRDHIKSGNIEQAIAVAKGGSV
ncbi:MAG: hypothetical protein KGJ07_08095 [Patescibacteria group bacterium]|nr:hypothetical protein [Patescibacteria group bacterium]